MKRALISVSDKTGVVMFARELVNIGYEIICTGGTQKVLSEAGIPTTAVDEITHFPEIMDGRVKTLHPAVHGALLCVRDNPNHVRQLQEHGIKYIDLVAINLYPFKDTMMKENVSHQELIEQIDIGGPSMLRSAAKNYAYIPVIVDPMDYSNILKELKDYAEIRLKTREYLAAKVFRYTASYDAMIAQYLTKKEGSMFPESITLTYEKVQGLRYGENPHQKAAFYKTYQPSYSIANATQLHGKDLSYNNIQDANACIEILKEFLEPCAVGVKHMNPCGVGIGRNIEEAWAKAYEADTTSIFGGIVSFNREVNTVTAKALAQLFLEVIIAPSFEEEALNILKKKQNIRILQLDTCLFRNDTLQVTCINDSILLQEADLFEDNKELFTYPTNRKPTEDEMKQLILAWKIVKHVKSNAITLVKNNMSIGIGAGQMNRIGAAKIAITQAGEKANGCVMASDAFFPMPDTVEVAASAGVKAIIQPGGSIQDQASIAACNKYNIAMVFTGKRHFKH